MWHLGIADSIAFRLVLPHRERLREGEGEVGRVWLARCGREATDQVGTGGGLPLTLRQGDDWTGPAAQSEIGRD